MVQDKITAFPELREFVKSHDQNLYDFCFYMLEGDSLSEEAVLDTFSEFSIYFRKQASQKNAQWDARLAKVELYRLAWQKIRAASSRLQYAWSIGRDTRQYKSLEANLLEIWRSGKREAMEWETAVLDRLNRIDPDFRAPLVLKDILGLSDDEVAEVLEIRWGVYRHRLHRGRVDFKDGLKGMVSSGIKEPAADNNRSAIQSL